MLIPIAYSSHQVRSAYVIDINMIKNTFFTMFLDFKHWVGDCVDTYLPPSNEVCEGYVFTPVCHSVHGGGGV